MTKGGERYIYIRGYKVATKEEGEKYKDTILILGGYGVATIKLLGTQQNIVLASWLNGKHDTNMEMKIS